MAKQKAEATATCPNCDTKIEVGRDPEVGQQVTCPECGEFLEVVGIEPLKLDWAD